MTLQDIHLGLLPHDAVNLWLKGAITATQLKEVIDLHLAQNEYDFDFEGSEAQDG